MITDLKKAQIDEELISRVAKRDREAFERLYESTRSIIYSYGLSILKNRQDAEDIMHDTYIKIFQSAASYQPSGKPLAWILTIVKHLSYNRLRDRKPTDNIEDYTFSSGDFSTDAENKMIVDSMIRTLSDEERQIVMLHAAGGLKHRETAEILGLPLSTILSKYNRAIKKLRTRFSGKETVI